MATSKTLTPTNVTIQIPAFADKPDQRANSDCIDKEADAINALSDQMVKIGNGIIKVKTVANTPIKVPCGSGYGEFIILGFVQGEGSKAIRCHVSNSVVYLFNTADNTTYSGNISVSYSANEISITDSTGNSYLVIVGTGAND